MKKLFIIFGMFISISILAQKETIFFPEKWPDILIGKQIKALPNKYEMYNFYELKRNSDLYVAGDSFKYYRKYVGKTFEVKDVISDKYGRKYLVLNEKGAKENLFFKYNERIASEFKFSILDFDIPVDFHCRKITQSGNDFYSPSTGVIQYMKTPESYYLTVKKFGDRMLMENSDIVLFLSNDTNIVFPNQKVKTEVSKSGSFEISTMLLLSQENISKLQEHDIVGYLIGSEPNRYPINEPLYRMYLNCLILK